MLVIVSALFIGLSSAIELRNLALGKAAYQTDTFPGGNAGNAVDGSLNQMWDSGSCAHTQSSKGVWWEVDLGDIYNIDNVKIYNRMDNFSHRLADVELYTGYGRSGHEYIWRGFRPGIVGSTHTFQMASITYGRWVRITRIGNHEQLQLCEVQVYGNDDVKKLRNLALGKAAYQTDTRPGGGNAGNAVDGSLNQLMDSGSCSHTQSSEGVWWEVDLGDIYNIDNVKIYNRMDRCSYRLADVELYTGYGRSDQDYVRRGFRPGIVGSTHTFQMASITYGRWVRITRIGNHEQLQLCEVQVYGNDVVKKLRNLALGKAAYQTDTHPEGGNAGNAVDGSLNQMWDSGSCSHTQPAQGVWWEVDLGDIYNIDNVKIYNRMDCCSYRLADVEVYTGYGRSDQDYVRRGFRPGIVGSTHTFQMASITYGRWVRITRIGNHESLQLCEVQVYGNDVVKMHFLLVPNQLGTGHVLESTTAASVLQCCSVCLVTSKCAAFNYKNVGTCDLLETVTSMTALTVNGHFYRYP